MAKQKEMVKEKVRDQLLTLKSFIVEKPFSAYNPNDIKRSEYKVNTDIKAQNTENKDANIEQKKTPAERQKAIRDYFQGSDIKVEIKGKQYSIDEVIKK